MIFADGIESDHVEFLNDHTVRIGVTDDDLNLLVPALAPVLAGGGPALPAWRGRPVAVGTTKVDNTLHLMPLRNTREEFVALEVSK